MNDQHTELEDFAQYEKFQRRMMNFSDGAHKEAQIQSLHREKVFKLLLGS